MSSQFNFDKNIKNITQEFTAWLKQKNTKQAQRVLKFMGKDTLSVWKRGNAIYVEPNVSYIGIPNYVYNQFERFRKHYYE